MLLAAEDSTIGKPGGTVMSIRLQSRYAASMVICGLRKVAEMKISANTSMATTPLMLHALYNEGLTAAIAEQFGLSVNQLNEIPNEGRTEVIRRGHYQRDIIDFIKGKKMKCI